MMTKEFKWIYTHKNGWNCDNLHFHWSNCESASRNQTM